MGGFTYQARLLGDGGRLNLLDWVAHLGDLVDAVVVGDDSGDGTNKELGVGLGLPLAKGVHGGDDVLDVSAGGLLVAGDVPANNNGLGGAVGLGVASLADGDGLSDNLADGGSICNNVVGIWEPVSEEELRVGVSISRGGGEGGGGQEGETKGNLRWTCFIGRNDLGFHSHKK